MLRLFLAVVAIALTASAHAQSTYPQKSVRLVLPFPPGGGTDTLGRILGQKLGESLGQTVVIDNRPGAGANIGAEIAAKAPPDGYTLLMGTVAHAINVTLYRKLQYDFVRDFAPVTMLGITPNIVVVHPSVPAKSVKELVALARSRPGALNYASSGSGSSAHLAGELFKSMARVDMVHVPYKGGGPAVANLVAGEASVGFATMPSALPHVKAAKLRALAVTTSTRSASAPEVPTVAEAGLPGYEASTWYCLLAPAGISKEIVARLHDDTLKALANADVKNRIAAAGYEIVTTTPDELAAYLKSEIDKWGRVVKTIGIRAD